MFINKKYSKLWQDQEEVEIKLKKAMFAKL